jgi:hypothetical protein
MKQYEAVILTIEKLGGIATLGKLYQEVFKIKDCNWEKVKTPFASIRRIVQTTKEIYKIKPGLYGLVKFKKFNEEKGFISETEKNQNKKNIIEFNHTYYQGLIVEIGNLENFQTYIPPQDKNSKYQLDKSLVELAITTTLPPFSYPAILKRAKTVDVIWFNERGMPYSFFEVEHTTDIEHSLLKFGDLQDFNSKFNIVADEKRKREFDGKINTSLLKPIKDKVKFLSYEYIFKWYGSALNNKGFEL